MVQERTTREVSAARMEQDATAFLAMLDAEQSALARLPFESDERLKWYYTPNARAGVPLSLLAPRQQQAAHRLVTTGVSGGGYATVTAIMGLENALDAEEGYSERFGWDFRARDPNRYYVAVFGEPGSDRWGWHFGGHHVSIHHTVLEGRVISPTPTFFGANPAELSTVGRTPLRPLADEEDLARELLHALDESQRAQAVLAPAAPDDLMLRNLPRAVEGATLPDAWQMMSMREDPRTIEGIRRQRERLGFTPERYEAVRYTAAPKGLAAAAMTVGQRDALRELVRQYLGRLPEDIAEHWMSRLTPVLDQVHFAWAGGFERRQPHYYRLQGPRFLVEYDNTQDGANHVHSVLRDPDGDFAADVLADHYAAHHAGAQR